MSGRIKRYPRTRTSKKFCEERFACDGDKVEAVYQCEECGTVQCSQCEIRLHQRAKFAIHDRRRITPPPKEQICQAHCVEQNFADVTCQNCEENYCQPCYDRLHAFGKKQKHKKAQFKVKHSMNSSPGLEGLLDVFNSLEEPVAPGNTLPEAVSDFSAIKPQSPVGNDNLTYFTTPQAQVDGHLTAACTPVLEGADDIRSNYFSLSNTNIPDIAFPENPTLSSKEILEMQPVTPHTRKDKVEKNPLKSLRDVPSAMVSPTTKHEFSSLHGSESDGGSMGDGAASPQSLECASTCSINSFVLADQNEILQVQDESDFVSLLGCAEDASVKVVSIFGNTGDGKSYTLNHTFFGGKEVFKTCHTPDSCTMGVWAAFDPEYKVILIDTEGLLGVTANQNKRTRLLLKVLAISDVVVYRTRAERLHEDLFTFLGDASKAYVRHFQVELKTASKKLKVNIDKVGPAVIIFHETVHTSPLKKGSSAVETLRKRFAEMDLPVEAYSSMAYVGTRTVKPPTVFSPLLAAIKNELKNTNVRSCRRPGVIFKALKVLNEKFSGNIERCLPETFPDQYFTCPVKCLSCGTRCAETVNHEAEEKPHQPARDSRCVYQHQYDNKVFLCKSCLDGRGRVVDVVPKTSSSTDNSWLGLAKYAWSGYVLECPACGIIYRSRQYWYGNEDPDRSVVKTEIRHIWPGGNTVLQGTHNAARRVLDGLNYMSDTLVSVGTKPTKMVSAWVTDKIAPPYWVPNSQITHCHSCDNKLDEWNPIHHCRACGRGFCDDCSANKRPVPERGWGCEPVRVCTNCFASSDNMTDSQGSDSDSQIVPRKVGEVLGSTVGAVASVMNYPLDVLRDSARPAYWIPDADITECCVCKSAFGPKLGIHHCRCCGQGVCAECSPDLRAVPSRGWDYPVRVCKSCHQRRGDL